MTPRISTAAVRGAVALLLLARPLAATLDEPQTVTSGTDVPPPKRVKSVPPEYPAAAQAQGIRGIVIVELIIDTSGKVASVKIVRSIPGLDEAAIAAVRKWEYTVTKVDGRPVNVRHTVPITFALRPPDLERQSGVPELRGGVTPARPASADTGQAASVTVEVSLDGAGQVVESEVRSGEPPFTEAVLQAVRTWRFAPDPEGAQVAFRVTVDFVPASRNAAASVRMAASGLRRSETLVTEATPSPTPTPETGERASAEPTATAPLPAPSPVASPEPSPLPKATRPEIAATPPTAPVEPTPAPKVTPPRVAPPPSPAVVPSPAARAAEEVVSPSSKPAAPAPRAEAGASSVRDVVLGVGVPDLVKGRRPVVPPFARIKGETGVVSVEFSVDAAGQCHVGTVNGPELLKPAAEQAVASWSFRRTSPERLRLTAAFTYRGDNASATVAVVSNP